jgi:hypothetical protein
MGTRVRNTLIDVGIVTVLVAHVAVFLVLRHDQTRHDGQARAIAAWMRDHDETRVAWPKTYRSAVPALLAAGVTPVLVDDAHVAPQQLALNQTGVAVTRGRSRLDPVTTDTRRFGSLTARLVNEKAAALIPLDGGDEIGQEIARPYIFAPIRNSLSVDSTHSFTTTVTLAPGKYALRVDAFSTTKHTRLVVEAGTVPAERVAIAMRPADPGPQTLGFRVKERGRRVRVQFRLSAEDANAHKQVYVHGWALERIA